MGALERELLYMAANTDLGIELLSLNPQEDFAALMRERAKFKELHCIQIRRVAQRPEALWLVRTQARGQAPPRGGK